MGSLTRAVMALEDDSAEAMFECILEWATVTKKMELYEAQEEAIMELVEGNSVLLTTPTGSGKTLVATAAIAAATARGDVRTREFHGTHNQRFQTNQTTRGGHPRDETTRRVSCNFFSDRAECNVATAPDKCTRRTGTVTIFHFFLTPLPYPPC